MDDTLNALYLTSEFLGMPDLIRLLKTNRNLYSLIASDNYIWRKAADNDGTLKTTTQYSLLLDYLFHNPNSSRLNTTLTSLSKNIKDVYIVSEKNNISRTNEQVTFLKIMYDLWRLGNRHSIFIANNAFDSADQPYDEEFLTDEDRRSWGIIFAIDCLLPNDYPLFVAGPYSICVLTFTVNNGISSNLTNYGREAHQEVHRFTGGMSVAVFKELQDTFIGETVEYYSVGESDFESNFERDMLESLHVTIELSVDDTVVFEFIS